MQSLSSRNKNLLSFKALKRFEKFEPRVHFKNRLSLIVRVNVVLSRTTVVVDSDRRFDNLCGSHLQSQSVFITSVDGIILWLLIDWSITWRCHWSSVS